jgi:hypothetical protein
MAFNFRILYMNVPSKVSRLLAIELMLQEQIWGGLRGQECLSVEEPGRGLVYRGLMCRRLWRWAPLSIGNPWDMGGKPVHREL